MTTNRKVLATLAVLLSALAMGGVLGWFATGPTKTDGPSGVPPTIETKPPLPVVASKTNASIIGTNRTRFGVRSPLAHRLRSRTNLLASAGTPAAGTNDEVWEQQIDTILTGTEDDSQKAKNMLALLPKLPEDGQEEAAEHITNLLPDEQYAAVQQLLTNPKTVEGVLDVLLSDLLNRPNGLKLPTLLEVAKSPDHPLAEEAKDFLELYLEQDFGQDWARWEQAMQAWLKDNPE